MAFNAFICLLIGFLAFASMACILVGIATGGSAAWVGSVAAVIGAFALMLGKPLLRIVEFYYPPKK